MSQHNNYLFKLFINKVTSLSPQVTLPSPDDPLSREVLFRDQVERTAGEALEIRGG